MSEIETFFRFCPSCGKRFHIKLVGKKLTDFQRETFEQKRVIRIGGMQMPPRGGYINPTFVEENVPVTVNVEDFQYSYKCKHCGHEWTENHTETEK